MSDIELLILGHIKWGAQEDALNKMKGEDAFGSRLFGQDRKSVVENVIKRLEDAGEIPLQAKDFWNFDDETLKLAED